MKLNITVILILLFTSLIHAQSPRDSEEFVGPFPSWASVKTYGAVGDGKTDDTAALQRALNEFPQKAGVLYLPAGRYRITKGLTMTSHMNVMVMGEDPAKTSIIWDGADDGVMMFCNGVRYSKFGRITWNGQGKPVTAYGHEWDGQTPNAATGLQHADEVFMDMAIGIRAGRPHFMDAETNVLRCKFIRLSHAGVRIQSFNALDWFIWDSEFIDCAMGVTNDPGAGHYHVYRCQFTRSTVADVVTGNAGYFSIRHNISRNSRRFVDSRMIGGWAVPLTVQGNTVLNPSEVNPICVLNAGPSLFIDNSIIQTPKFVNSPPIFCWAYVPAEYVGVGNISNSTKTLNVTGRLLEIGSQTKQASEIRIPDYPVVAAPVNKQRKIFEVPVKSDEAAIFAAIGKALKLTGQRAVVHIPMGEYKITKPIVLPAGSDLQLVGDGYQTSLRWEGAAGGSMLMLKGPSHVTLRDFRMSGNDKQNGLVVTNCDQPNSRLFGDDVMVNGSNQALLVNRLANTDVMLRSFYPSCKAGLKVIGSDKAAQDKPANTRTVLFGGASSNCASMYSVENGGRLMAQDIWYEGQPTTFTQLKGSGTFTLSGAQVAPGRAGPNASPSDPAAAGISIVDFSGKASFLTNVVQTRALVTGKTDKANVMLMGIQAGDAQVLVPPPAGAKVSLLFSRRYATAAEGEPPTRSLPDVGSADPAWVLSMLQQLRTDTPQWLTVKPKSVTDVRIYRVQIDGFNNGILLQP